MNIGILSVGQGAKAVITKQFDPIEVLDVIESYSVSNVLVVPAIIQALIAVPDVGERNLSTLKHVVYGASPISEQVLLEAQRLFGCGFTQLYGMTETVGAGTYLSTEAHDPSKGKLRSCGVPYPGFDIKVVDGDGKTLPPNGVGQILIKSDTVMKGYWNNPDATASVLIDGWYYSGDAGYFDADGYLLYS